MTQYQTHTGEPTLVLLSGGLDSTAMLYKYLTETKKHIHVHHVQMGGQFSNRASVEIEHVMKIVSWLRDNTRPFDFSYSSIDTPGYGGGTVHSFYAMMAASVCIEYGFGVVASGRIATDKTTNGERNMRIAQQIFHAATSNIMQKAPQWVLPVDQMCKRDLIKTIPKELFALTWSCQYPQKKEDGTYHECRKCIGCARRTEAMIDSKQFDPIPDEVLESLLEEDITEYVTKNDYKFHPPLFKFHGSLS